MTAHVYSWYKFAAIERIVISHNSVPQRPIITICFMRVFSFPSSSQLQVDIPKLADKPNAMSPLQDNFFIGRAFLSVCLSCVLYSGVYFIKRRAYSSLRLQTVRHRPITPPLPHFTDTLVKLQHHESPVSAVAISSVENLETQLPLRRKDMGCASVESIGESLFLKP